MEKHLSRPVARAAFAPDRALAWAPQAGSRRHRQRRSGKPRRLSLRSIAFATLAAAAAFAAGALGAFLLDRFAAGSVSLPPEIMRVVVERIVHAESRGDPDAKNPRSSATGAAQFIDATWLELMRKHRTDLKRRSDAEILELRRDPALAREMTARFIERNASLLQARGLPITPATLYLSHFAGGAGAAAILLAAEDADAAHIMASADRTGRMSRDKIVKANPFLEGVTAAGLQKWAERKMREPKRF